MTPEDNSEIKQIEVKSSKKSLSPFLFGISILVTLSAGVIIGNKLTLIQFAAANSLDLSSVQATYKVLNDNFDGKIDRTKAVEGANRGLVNSLNDPYTEYFNKKEAAQFDKDLNGTFEGIGAELAKRDGKLMIVSPLEGSPAKEAGLLPKDVIARVNGEDTTSWSIDKAILKIKGEKGTTVKLTIIRGEEVKEVSITRAVITSPSVKNEVRGKVGIITISRFSEDTTALTRKAAHDFVEQGVSSVVLDLRGNGGGFLTSAQDISSLWLENGKNVVQERRGDTVIETHKSSGNPILKGMPTVVLIDEGSASASEIVAGALKDNNAAKLVGQKSFGKGSVQKIVNLENGAKVKVTIAKWYTPNGKNISKQGITPDYKVNFGKDDTIENDPQLNKSIELLN